MTTNGWIKRNTAGLDGRTVAISGATGGIGKELCSHLCSLGANLILLDRNRQKSQALGKSLTERFSHISVSYITVDMENIDSVRVATEKLLQTKVDFLILNAGAYAIPRKKCDTGYDNVFQINFVSPYYMARRLFPLISQRGGRIVAVSSIAHNYSVTDMSDVDFSSRKKASLVYGNAKRFLTYSLSELYAESGALSITHPGITFTNITAHYPKLIFAIIKYPMKVIFMKPRKAALSILLGIFSPTAKSKWIGPRFFNVWGLPKKKILNTASATEIKEISDCAERIFTKITEDNPNTL